MREGRAPPHRTAGIAASALLALALAPLAFQGPLSAPVPSEENAPHATTSTSGAPVVPSSGLEALRLELTRFLTTGTARNGNWGVLAVSLAQGDTLFALNPDVPRSPASNQKIFTSAAALHHLGPDFRFPTFLLADGEISDGVLDGNLILYGTGDPTIGDRLLPDASDPLRDFARALRERGIHTVAGDVLGDGTFFHGPTRRPSWNARDLNEWYAAPVSGMTFNENMVTLRITPGSPGERPRILTEPAGAVLPFANEGWTVSGRPGRTLRLVRDDPDDPIRLMGEMSPGQADVWRRLTVSDPAAFAASVMLRVLGEEGIQVQGASRSVAG
ncbi:MAG: D-alanyl-D-alanine carboxypeptidase/D-alanyl-D-alanine-endopeptidase, partial [Gemmatimonadota bacterium]